LPASRIGSTASRFGEPVSNRCKVIPRPDDASLGSTRTGSGDQMDTGGTKSNATSVANHTT